MSKRPTAPSDERNPGKRKNFARPVRKLGAWHVLAKHIPAYLGKQPPLNSELFVYVEVEMLWPDSGKASLVDVLMCDAEDKPARFTAFFTKNSSGFFRHAKQSDRFCIYLSDAKLHQVEDQCKQDTLNLPFTLTWDTACRLKRVEKDRMVSDIVFPTPDGKGAKAKEKTLGQKKDSSPISPPEPGFGPLEGVAHPHDAAPAEIETFPGDRYPTPQPEDVCLTKPRRSGKGKPQKEGQGALMLQQLPQPPSNVIDHAEKPNDPGAVSLEIADGSSNQLKREIIDLTNTMEEWGSAVQAPESNEDPTGLRAGWGQFVPLNDISCSTDIQRAYSTIGVVTYAREVTETRTRELSQHVNLTDPSYPNADIPAVNYMGHGITMFAKRQNSREWLPSPKYGDILILKGIKRAKNNQVGDYCSVIFWDRLKWAIYDPATESVMHKNFPRSPRKTGADDYQGVVMDPFYEPEPAELRYCKRLSGWWKAIERKGAKGDSVARRSTVTARKMVHRIHRLISETDHESEPGGYFDCTVQVLSGFKNDNCVYSLYVTDFTKNRALGHNDKWPKGRNGTVLRVEMWDSAATRGPSLKNKGYYRLENCRMLNHDGYLQAKMVEPKIRELSKNDESDLADPRFAQLLEREEGFEKESNVPLTLENAPDESFFDCIVELLGRTSEGSDVFLHVTDYTPVPEIFKSTFSQEPEFDDLGGRVVKVRVRGSLAERGLSMPMVNSYYLLEKMRFLQTGGTWVCDIKDNHGFIVKLNPANAGHNGIAEIKRRRKWVGSSVVGSSRACSLITDPGGKLVAVLAEPPLRVSMLPQKEELPVRFEVKARILDFYPISLDENCLLRVCGDCKDLIAESAESCLRCSSLAYQSPVVFRYTLLFMLGTENGDELVAAAGNIDNGFIDGIRGQDEDDALHQLKTLLQPLVGNLFEIHEHWLRKEDTELQPDTPLVNFKLNAWAEEEEEKEIVVRYAVQDIRSYNLL